MTSLQGDLADACDIESWRRENREDGTQHCTRKRQEVLSSEAMAVLSHTTNQVPSRYPPLFSHAQGDRRVVSMLFRVCHLGIRMGRAPQLPDGLVKVTSLKDRRHEAWSWGGRPGLPRVPGSGEGTDKRPAWSAPVSIILVLARQELRGIEVP